MSLREEIWNEVRPLVQDYRLNIEDGNDHMAAVAKGCKEVAEGAIRSRLAQELNSTGRVLSDDDLRWLQEEMAALLGGLGALLPPFMAAPRRRREQSKLARAWQLWTRRLAELARAGAGLNDAIAAGVPYPPPPRWPCGR